MPTETEAKTKTTEPGYRTPSGISTLLQNPNSSISFAASRAAQ
jgi:hypothetical protein